MIIWFYYGYLWVAFIDIIVVYVNGSGAMIRLHFCQWRYPVAYMDKFD